MRFFAVGLCILPVLALNAYATPFLGTAGSFAVLGATPSVTNTGPTTLTGFLGVSPAASITGAIGITVNGTNAATGGNPNVFAGVPTATTAQTDASTAFTNLAALSPTTNHAGAGAFELGGLNLGAGVYKLDSALLNGVLTLDFGGLANLDFVFQIASTLTTASGPGIASVVILNAAANDNVYWQVGSSAQIGTYTSFAGDIIANTTVAMQTGATDLCGSVISLTAAVTLDTNTISNVCPIMSGGTTIGTFGSGGDTTHTTITTPGAVSGTVQTSVPEGGSTLLYLSFFLLPIGAMQAFRRRRSN